MDDQMSVQTIATEPTSAAVVPGGKYKARGKKARYGDDWVSKLTRRNTIDPKTGKRNGPQLDRDTIPDPDGRGLFLRIGVNDTKSYVCTARCKRPADAKHSQPWYEQVWHTIGQVGALNLTEDETKLLPVTGEIGIARRRAETIIARIKSGLAPVEPKPLLPAPPKPAGLIQAGGIAETFEQVAKRDPLSFDGVADRYLKEEAYVFTRYEEYERVFKKHCHPAFGARPFVEIRRRDINDLTETVCISMKDAERIEQRLAELEALRADPKSAYWKRDDAARALHTEYRRLQGNGGARMADSIASKVHALQVWFESEDDGEDLQYKAPALCKKRNKEPKKREALTHAEIKSFWEATDNIDTYGAILRLLLLTGQRLSKVREMKWADIDFAAGTWNVPRGNPDRTKGVGGLLVLSPLALSILNERRGLTGNYEFVFPGRAGNEPFRSSASAQIAVKARMNGSRPWTPHWLRHTASTLMGEAGVRPDVKELTLGHARKGVEGRYDHSTLTADKGVALAKLAASVEQIVGLPQAGGAVVVQLSLTHLGSAA